MITTAAQESKPKDENSYRKVQNVVTDCTEFVSTPAPADTKENYGGMFWLNRPPRMDRVPKDTYWPAGFMGQVTMVIPSRDMVVVRMGPNPGGVYPYLNETIGRILEAIP